MLRMHAIVAKWSREKSKNQMNQMREEIVLVINAMIHSSRLIPWLAFD